MNTNLKINLKRKEKLSALNRGDWFEWAYRDDITLLVKGDMAHAVEDDVYCMEIKPNCGKIYKIKTYELVTFMKEVSINCGINKI